MTLVFRLTSWILNGASHCKTKAKAKPNDFRHASERALKCLTYGAHKGYELGNFFFTSIILVMQWSCESANGNFCSLKVLSSHTKHHKGGAAASGLVRSTPDRRGLLCCVLRPDTLLALCLSLLKCINGYWWTRVVSQPRYRSRDKQYLIDHLARTQTLPIPNFRGAVIRSRTYFCQASEMTKFSVHTP